MPCNVFTYSPALLCRVMSLHTRLSPLLYYSLCHSSITYVYCHSPIFRCRNIFGKHLQTEILLLEYFSTMKSFLCGYLDQNFLPFGTRIETRAIARLIPISTTYDHTVLLTQYSCLYIAQSQAPISTASWIF